MRKILCALAVGFLFFEGGGLALAVDSLARKHLITVYKSPYCGCCTKWEAHLRENGFDVKTELVENVHEIKTKHGIPPEASSCHTGVVNGYFVEGHVPAKSIKKMLQERPKIAGLSVPGMPIGSPGMEGPDPVAYDVLSLDKMGRSKRFMRIDVTR